MTIPTQMSLQGYIASAPELTFTGKGHARFFCRVGIEQHRKEVDGRSPSSTPPTATWCFSTRLPSGRTRGSSPATRSCASGHIHEYEQERPGGPSQIREQFVARRIGHDCARTRYIVDRTPAQQPDPPNGELNLVNEPAQSVSI
jgi:hypothetical protein